MSDKKKGFIVKYTPTGARIRPPGNARVSAIASTKHQLTIFFRQAGLNREIRFRFKSIIKAAKLVDNKRLITVAFRKGQFIDSATGRPPPGAGPSAPKKSQSGVRRKRIFEGFRRQPYPRPERPTSPTPRTEPPRPA